MKAMEGRGSVSNARVRSTLGTLENAHFILDGHLMLDCSDTVRGSMCIAHCYFSDSSLLFIYEILVFGTQPDVLGLSIFLFALHHCVCFSAVNFRFCAFMQ